MSLKKQEPFFSIVVIPPSGGRSLSLRFSRRRMVFFAGIFLGGVFLSLLLLFFVGRVGIDFAEYRKLRQEALQHQEQMDQLQTKFRDLKSDIELLLERDAEIRDLFGRSRAALPLRPVLSWEASRQKLGSRNPTEWRSAVGELFVFVGALKQNFMRFSQLAQQYRVRYAFTPSIWPLFGAITSGHGFRMHPVTGMARMHNGIDIPSWTGAPIKTAADGLVLYSGWSSGFGNVVVVDHNFGIRTIYAHASRLLVTRGDLVKKGQVIAQVGSTGISTGPHLHYEVRRGQQALNPRRYLDLDMFTASAQVW